MLFSDVGREILPSKQFVIFHTSSLTKFLFLLKTDEKLQKYSGHRAKFSYTHIILLWCKICSILCAPFLSQFSKTSWNISINISIDLEWHKYFWIHNLAWSFCLKIISPFWSKMTHCASYFFPHPLYWPLFLFTRLKCHFSSCSNSALHFHNFLLYYILFEEIQHFSISIHVICCFDIVFSTNLNIL